MRIRELRDVPAAPGRQSKRVVAVLEGDGGESWGVCLKRGLFSCGEKVLFVAKDVLIRDDRRIKDAARTSYRRKTLFLKGGVRNAYIIMKSPSRPADDNNGAILSLDPFTELHGVPLGADVSARMGATDEETLQREEAERRRAREELRSAAATCRAAPRAAAPASGNDRRARLCRDEAAADGRMCFFGGPAPSVVHMTSLSHLEEHPEYFANFRDVPFDVTEKENGLNMTLYCSRRGGGARPLHLCIGGHEVRWSPGSYYWRLLHELGILQRIVESGRNVSLEGVVVGPGIRSGYDDGYRRAFFLVFDAFDIDAGRTMDAQERRMFCGRHGIPMVHEVFTGCQLLSICPDLAAVSALAAQNTARGVRRHGLVARSLDPAVPLWFDVACP